MTLSDTTQTKRRLRQWARATRSGLTNEARAEAAAQLVRSIDPVLVALLAPSRLLFGGYRAMPDELDPGPLMAALAARGGQLALPRMIGKGQALQFHLWRPGDSLVAGTWGIKEPLASARKCLPDILLVPLLAVDLKGNRLGYGGGYYDRTIEAVRLMRAIWGMAPLITVGLALDALVVDAVPQSDYDKPLDWVLTPTRAIEALR